MIVIDKAESLVLSPDIVVERIRYSRGPEERTLLAKRYRRPSTSDPTGLTFLLLHGGGSCKEMWEPTIGHLYSVERPPSGLCINEFWSIEGPANGESSVYNEDHYMKTIDSPLNLQDYYLEAIHKLLTAGPDNDAKIDFTKRALVGVGHCIGATALVFLPRIVPQLNFVSMILCEPAMGPNSGATIACLRKSAHGHLSSQTVWPSHKAASTYFRTKHPETKAWCAQALDIQLTYTLRPHRASRFAPPFTFEAVTIIPNPDIKTALHRAKECRGEGLEEAVTISKRLPMHIIWGERPDAISDAVKCCVSDLLAGQSSSRYISGAGHFIPQEVPDKLAAAIHRILEVRARL